VTSGISSDPLDLVGGGQEPRSSALNMTSSARARPMRRARCCAAYASLDLCDADEAACAQVSKQQAVLRFADQPRRLLPQLLDPGHVDVRNEIVAVGAREHELLVELVVMDEFGIRPLCPTPWGCIDLVGKDAYGHRDGTAVRLCVQFAL